MTDTPKGSQSPPHADDDDIETPHPDEARRRRHDELLDEGVEETFPASDPVAVKHIT